MSSISDDDNNSSTLSNHTDRLQPVFPDGTAIIWDGNDAHIAGALFECKRFFTRTGLFKSLIEHRAAPVGKGLLAVKHVQSAPFIMGTYTDARDFDNPSPPGPQRFTEYRNELIRTGTAAAAAPVATTTLSDDDKKTVILAPHVVDAEDSRLLVSLTYVFRSAYSESVETCLTWACRMKLARGFLTTVNK